MTTSEIEARFPFEFSKNSSYVIDDQKESMESGIQKWVLVQY